jgi:hypothetical protein
VCAASDLGEVFVRSYIQLTMSLLVGSGLTSVAETNADTIRNDVVCAKTLFSRAAD